MDQDRAEEDCTQLYGRCFHTPGASERARRGWSRLSRRHWQSYLEVQSWGFPHGRAVGHYYQTIDYLPVHVFHGEDTYEQPPDSMSAEAKGDAVLEEVIVLAPLLDRAEHIERPQIGGEQ